MRLVLPSPVLPPLLPCGASLALAAPCASLRAPLRNLRAQLEPGADEEEADEEYLSELEYQVSTFLRCPLFCVRHPGGTCRVSMHTRS
jgi:hypothetical protein